MDTKATDGGDIFYLRESEAKASQPGITQLFHLHRRLRVFPSVIEGSSPFRTISAVASSPIYVCTQRSFSSSLLALVAQRTGIFFSFS